MADFIEMKTFVSNNCIDIMKIEDFEKLIIDNKIGCVFYGKRTARNSRGKCFLVNINSVFYSFTYYFKYGLFINIDDYKDALKNGFSNAMEYYFSKEYEITNYKEFHDYILLNYRLDDTEIKKSDNDEEEEDGDDS
jgi:hypothetical protein